MKILVLNYEYPPLGGGGGVITQNLVEELIRKKHKVTLVTSRYKDQKFLEKKKGLHIYRLNVFRKQKQQARISEMFLYVLQLYFFLVYLRFKEKFDAINIHFAIPTGAAGWFARLLFSKKITLVLHGADIPNKERPKYTKYYNLVTPIIRFILSNSDNVVVVNPEVRKTLKKLSDAKPVLIPNGVDSNRFYPRNIKKKYDVLFFGRLIEMKNPQLAVESFKKLAKLKKDASMLIVGDGELYDNLKKQAKGYDITFLRWIDHEKTPDIINGCRIYWSLQKRTNYGSLTLLEAMSCGLPPVLTDVGNSSVFAPHKDLLVKNDPKNVAETTYDLLSEKKKFLRFQKMTLAHIEKYYMKNLADKYLAIF